MADIAGFLALPRELRDCVYHYRFLSKKGTLLRFRHDKLQVIATYGVTSTFHFLWAHVRNVTKPGLPLWLLANKQVFIEALEQFHHQAKFMCMDNFPFRLNGLVISRHLSLHRARIVDLQEYIPPLINVWEECDLDGTRARVFRYQQHVARLYQETMHKVLNPWSALRILTLGISIDEELTPLDLDAVPHRFYDEVGFISNLSRSLMKVKFVLSVHFFDLPHGYIWPQDYVYRPAALQEELKRIALLLVDDEDVICVEKKDPVGYQARKSSGNGPDFLEFKHYGWSLEVTTASYRRGLGLEMA